MVMGWRRRLDGGEGLCDHQEMQAEREGGEATAGGLLPSWG